MANSLDATTMVNIAKNRGRLLRLTEGFKGHRPSKKCLRLDPAYSGNIQHLVFGTYRACVNTPPRDGAIVASASGQEGSATSGEGHAASAEDRLQAEEVEAGKDHGEMPLTSWRQVQEDERPPKGFRKAHSLSEKRSNGVTCQIRITPPTRGVTSWAEQSRRKNDVAWPNCQEESPPPLLNKEVVGSSWQEDGPSGEPILWRGASRSERHLHQQQQQTDAFQRLHASRATDSMLHKFRRSVAIVMRAPSGKRAQRNGKCNSADSGIQIESSSTSDSPAPMRRRAASISSPVLGIDTSVRKRIGPDVVDGHTRCSVAQKETENLAIAKVRNKPAPLRRISLGTKIRRSLSQPLDLERLALRNDGLSEREPSSEDESSDEIPSPLSAVVPSLSPSGTECRPEVTFAEALWDHVTIDTEELPFKAGQVVEVTDSADRDWWWGSIGDRSGWFPAAFVRLRVSQEDTVEDCMVKMAEGTLTRCRANPRKTSVSLLSNDQVRANVVREIISTERDFVRHLRDLVQGYLKQAIRRTDMFTPEQVSAIFGNIEEIYRFQSCFLRRLEGAICWEAPHLSQVGRCFLEHKDKFEIYSEYCNNHPLAVSQLQELYADAKYIHFFEACRLLQQMIDISFDGFLLTPVQKICKYPLQLAELLKYTQPDHPDHGPVSEALVAMRGVAQLVNERKRRTECLEKLADWQRSIDQWEGPEILETSSVLIHSGEVTRVTSNWSRDLSLFLFDHLLVYCKKDLLKRNSCVYKGRINVDCCCVFDVEDGKDAQFGVWVKNGWKVYCAGRDKWFLFYVKTAGEKRRWLQAFREERQHVREDRERGFGVGEQDKKVARASVLNRLKPKRPRAKVGRKGRPHPDTAVVAEIFPDTPCAKTRSGSLPSSLSPSAISKKKGSGWFHFGSGKKSKK